MAEVGINATQLSAPQGQGAEVVRAVEIPVAQDLVTPFVGQVASIFAKGMENDRKSKAEEFKQTVLKRYATEQDTINQGITTGALSASQAASQSKRLYSKYVAGFSQYGTELEQLRKSFSAGTELSDAEQEVKDKKDQRKQLLADATKEGFAYPGMSVESEEAVLKQFQTVLKARSVLSDVAARNTETRTQYRFDKEIEQYNDRQSSFTLVNEIAGAGLDALRAEANDLRAQVTKNPASFQQAQTQLGDRISRINASLQAAARLNPELAAPYRAIMDQYSSALLKSIDPKETADSLKSVFDTMLLKVKIGMGQDPEVLSAIAISDLFQGNAVAVFQASQVVHRALALGSGMPLDQNERVPLLVGTPDEKAALDVLKDAVKGMKGTDAVAAQASNTVNHFFLHIGKSIDAGASPDKLANIVDFTSSPEFLKLVKEGKIDANAKNQVTRAIQMTWEKAAIEGVSKTFYGPIFKGSNFYDMLYSTYGNKSVSEIVNVTFNGTGIAFTPKVPATTPKDIEAQKRVLSYLESSARVVNKMIQSGAHLEGSSNYAATWEKVKPMLFPTMAIKETPAKENPAPAKAAPKTEESKPVSTTTPSDADLIEKALVMMKQKDPNLNIDYVRNSIETGEPAKREQLLTLLRKNEGKQ